MRLWMVRHGKSIWNEEERIQGQQDVPLSDEGRQQAIALGQRLKGIPFTACFASPLQRAMETAHILLAAAQQQVPITPLPALKERCFGAWEGKQLTQLRQEEAFRHWVSQQSQTAPFGGETLDEFIARVGAGVREIISLVSEGNVLVVAHSGTIKAALCALFRLPPTSFIRFIVPNASVTIVEVKGSQPTLVQHGAFGTPLGDWRNESLLY